MNIEARSKITERLVNKGAAHYRNIHAEAHNGLVFVTEGKKVYNPMTYDTFEHLYLLDK